VAMTTKGIILAGGAGTRLWPMTEVVSKQLLPVYDKPLIYYPLSTLMLAGIRDILIISTPRDSVSFQLLLDTGAQFGLNISYAVQAQPAGIAQALIIGKEFINNSRVALILGDNIFYGQGLQRRLRNIAFCVDGAVVLSQPVQDPQRYGVVELDAKGWPISIEEKPILPKSFLAVTGLYFYDNTATSRAEKLVPSARNELEITDLNKSYMHDGALRVEPLGRGSAWFDTGTADALLQASTFVQTVQQRQGLLIGCVEEIAFRLGWINKQAIQSLISTRRCSYTDYLRKVLFDMGTK